SMSSPSCATICISSSWRPYRPSPTPLAPTRCCSCAPSHRDDRYRAALRGRARGHDGAECAARGGGHGGPTDARCEPDQVAFGTHDVVLRDVHPEGHAELSAVPSAVRDSLQLVLQHAWATVVSPASWP